VSTTGAFEYPIFPGTAGAAPDYTLLWSRLPSAGNRPYLTGRQPVGQGGEFIGINYKVLRGTVMQRRRYFLLPDREHTCAPVKDLTELGIRKDRLHTLANRGVSLAGLPNATLRRRHDTGRRLEKILWTANLAAFGLALTALVTLVILPGLTLWVLGCLALMPVTFLVGPGFTHRAEHPPGRIPRRPCPRENPADGRHRGVPGRGDRSVCPPPSPGSRRRWCRVIEYRPGMLAGRLPDAPPARGPGHSALAGY